MKNLYSEHKTLIKGCVIISLLILVWGVILVVDAIQKERRSSNTTEDIIINQDSGEIRSYNVDGLTDEQIEQMLKIERNNRREE